MLTPLGAAARPVYYDTISDSESDERLLSLRTEEENRSKSILLMSHFVAAGRQSWFARIFGFEETAGGRLGTFAFVRSELRISQTPLNAHVLTTPQGKELWAGRFTQESLSHLRSKLQVSECGAAL